MKKNVLVIVSEIWTGTAGAVKRSPVLLLPLLLTTMLDLFMLTLLYYVPRPPLRMVLGPLVGAGWGTRFLHYPVNFSLLPKLYTFSRHLFGSLAGVLITGITLSLARSVIMKRRADIVFSFRKAVSRYWRLLGVWALVSGTLFSVSVMIDTFAGVNLHFSGRFTVIMIVKAFFVFSLPAVIINNRKVVSSLRYSIKVFSEYPAVSLMIVALPGLLFIPLNYLHAALPHLKDTFYPETALYVLGARAVVVSAADYLITLTAALFLITVERGGR